MSIIIALLGIAAWLIGHKWIGLSELTAFSIFIAVFLVLLSITDITTSRKSRERIQKSCKCTAVVLARKEVHGYRGRTTYTVELHPEFDKVVLKKNNLRKDLQVNDCFDAYPIYNKDHHIIDFDDAASMQTQLFKPVHIAAVLAVALSIFLTVNDGSRLLREVSTILFGLLMSVFLLAIGIQSLHRYIVIRNHNLTPVKAVIHDIVIVERLQEGLYRSINPIYRAVVKGEVYQFSGSDNIAEEDIGKEVTAYYDDKNMEFFEASEVRSKSDLIISLVLFAISIGLLYKIFE